MNRVVLVSFDELSNGVLENLEQLLSEMDFCLVTNRFDDPVQMGRSSETEDREGDEGFRVIGEMEVEAEPGLKVRRLITPGLGGDGKFGKGSIEGHGYGLGSNGRRPSSILLKKDEKERVDILERGLSAGDMLIALVDSDSYDSVIPASYLSARAMEIGCFSFCLVLNGKRFGSVQAVHEVNRTYLELSINFHGTFGIPPSITMRRRYLFLAQGVRLLADMIYKSGLVNLDHADLLSTSRGGRVLVMTWGSAQPGGDPSATSIDDALRNPLCDVDLSTVQKAMVNVVGSEKMALEDSLTSSEILRRRIRSSAQIIWGVTTDQPLEEDLEVFIIMATTPLELLLHWYSRQ